MATIFLSHASRDDDLARQLEAWLKAEGFDDLFVDHSDIRGGDKWTEALRLAKGAARVVLCLVTPRWLASDECFSASSPPPGMPVSASFLCSRSIQGH